MALGHGSTAAVRVLLLPSRLTRPTSGAGSWARCSTPSAEPIAVASCARSPSCQCATRALVLDGDLAARYGKTTGTAFAGIVAGPNKVMRRVARRDLITWDADARGYRMDPADAEIVLRALART